MAENRGKKFETKIREQFLKIPGISIDRLHDQTTGFKGSQNICDFIVYRYPYEYYIECKTIHGASLPFTNITDTQWKGLLDKSKIPGVFAGIICWWVDKEVTKFIPIELLQYMKERDEVKSYNYQFEGYSPSMYSSIDIAGKKKRVFFEYDLDEFLKEVSRHAYGL